MTPGTNEMQKESGAYSVAWLGAAVGASIGIAALAYSRRPRTRWDRARERASDLIQTARKEAKPWMGAAAGAAAAGTALALYMHKPQESAWQRVGKRAGDMASRVGSRATTPWANLAATAAVCVASVAYGNRAGRRTIRGIDASTAGKINMLTEKGLQVLRRVRNISEQGGKLYTRGRRAIA